jgi:hypothetical protein
MDGFLDIVLALVCAAVGVAFAIPLLALTLSLFYAVPLPAFAAIVAAVVVAAGLAYRLWRRRRQNI